MIYTIYFVILVLLQFAAPFLAKKIKNRFGQLGIEMKSETNTSLLNTSGFWAEAKRLNISTKDALVSKYLWIFNSWWILFSGGMVALFFGVGY